MALEKGHDPSPGASGRVLAPCHCPSCHRQPERALRTAGALRVRVRVTGNFKLNVEVGRPRRARARRSARTARPSLAAAGALAVTVTVALASATNLKGQPEPDSERTGSLKGPGRADSESEAACPGPPGPAAASRCFASRWQAAGTREHSPHYAQAGVSRSLSVPQWQVRSLGRPPGESGPTRSRLTGTGRIRNRPSQFY
jgi:hypothetical protein